MKSMAKNYFKKIRVKNFKKPSSTQLILLLVVVAMIVFKFKSEHEKIMINGKDYSKNHAGEADLYHPYGETFNDRIDLTK